MFDPVFAERLANLTILAILAPLPYLWVGWAVDRIDHWHRIHPESGQALVEAALVLPILLSVLLAGGDFIRYSTQAERTADTARTLAAWTAYHGTAGLEEQADMLEWTVGWSLAYEPPGATTGEVVTITYATPWSPAFTRGFIAEATITRSATAVAP